jgi:type VI secretion system protein ImpI
MTCQLKIVSEHRDIVGNDAVRVFHEEGGTIGRSLRSDWILPDPDRYISGRHATIDFRGGMYYLVDTSSNGVYINGDCNPVGKGNVRRLFDGDILRFGDFEIAVTIDQGESIATPLDATDSHIREHVAPLVPEVSMATGVQLLDEEEMTGDGDFQSALFSSPDDPEEVAEPEPAPRPAEPPKRAVPRELADADLVATDIVDSFLDGLGLNRSELPESVDLAQLMQTAGEVLREFVGGITGLLASRANMKNAFKLDQTTVLPRHNNPIKLSANTRDSIKQLLFGSGGENIASRDAAREVCQDLLFHQDALLEAMAMAFDDFSDRFEPEELAETFDRNLSSNPLLRWRNKSKYWQMYADLYPILTEKGSGRYPETFAQDFVAAYERHLAEFKRLGGASLHLKETVILNESQRGIVPPPLADADPEPGVPEETEDSAATEPAETAEEPVEAEVVEADPITLNEPAARVLKELEELEEFQPSPSAANDSGERVEIIAEGDDFEEIIDFDDATLDDLPDTDTDQARG